MIFLNKKNYKIKTNAKINVGLNVYEKYENSYHNIDSIMLPISLADTLDILIDNSIGDLEIECSSKSVPTDKRNILYKTYELFFETIKKEKQKIFVKLEKNIPSEAGLGGGSSNAGGFLKILNSHYNNVLSLEELKKLALKIGSDVPFFLENKTSRIKGMGDEISVLENNLSTSLILIKPEFGVSTKDAYESFDNLEKVEVKYAHFENIEEALKENDVVKVSKNIENCLEQGILKINSQINFFRKQLETLFPCRNIKFFMSGSGSTYYTFVREEEKVEVETRLRTFLDDVEIFMCKILK